MSVLLSAQGLRLAFGGVRAADGIDLEVMEGEFLAIIGPNGAGKTTFINMTTGYLRPQAGAITYRGQNLIGLSPRRIVQLGVARSFQPPPALHRAHGAGERGAGDRGAGRHLVALRAAAAPGNPRGGA